jgi:hypothetical protein
MCGVGARQRGTPDMTCLCPDVVGLANCRGVFIKVVLNSAIPQHGKVHTFLWHEFEGLSTIVVGNESPKKSRRENFPVELLGL